MNMKQLAPKTGESIHWPPVSYNKHPLSSLAVAVAQNIVYSNFHLIAGIEAHSKAPNSVYMP